MRLLLLILLLALTSGAQETRSFLAVRTRDGAILAQQDPDRLLVPASALKILTAARALSLPARETTLWYEDGVLTLQGGGDPTLTSQALQELAAQVVQPVTAIQVDPGPDLGVPYGPGWAWEDMSEDYQPEVCGLTVDGGLASITVTPDGVEGDLPARRQPTEGELQLWYLPGREQLLIRGRLDEPMQLKVPVPEPDLWAGKLLAQALKLDLPVQRGQARGTLIARHLSAPTATILREALKDSDNLVMEMLYRQLPSETSPGRVVDGCGLSRYNLLSVRTLVETLQRSPKLYPLLPRPGEGTLKKRFLDRPLNLVAKTGTLGGVSALAGVLEPGTEDEIVFAVITNGALDTKAVKLWEEAWVSGLAEAHQEQAFQRRTATTALCSPPAPSTCHPEAMTCSGLAERKIPSSRAPARRVAAWPASLSSKPILRSVWPTCSSTWPACSGVTFSGRAMRRSGSNASGASPRANS